MAKMSPKLAGELADHMAREMEVIEALGSALEIAATGISRDPSRNAVWIAGEAAVVHAIEDGLRTYHKWQGKPVKKRSPDGSPLKP